MTEEYDHLGYNTVYFGILLLNYMASQPEVHTLHTPHCENLKPNIEDDYLPFRMCCSIVYNI
jgi:hypothetical protein